MLNYEDLEPVEVVLKDFCESCNLELLSGNENESISFSSVLVNRPGLLLAGFKDYFGHSRVQLIGNAEHYYLEQLPLENRKKVVEDLFSQQIPCIIYSRGINPTDEEYEASKKYNIPLLGSKNTTTYLSNIMSSYLDELLAPMTTIHGTLMDVAGVGVLITGESGMGKSEAALDLIRKGNRLIADDIVIAKRISGRILGSAPEKTKNLMEVRGLGILDIAAAYGANSVLDNEYINVIVELKNYVDGQEVERLGNKSASQNILDLSIPKFTIPVKAGRSLSTLIEVAVTKYRLKQMGHDAYKTLLDRTGLEE